MLARSGRRCSAPSSCGPVGQTSRSCSPVFAVMWHDRFVPFLSVPRSDDYRNRNDAAEDWGMRLGQTCSADRRPLGSNMAGAQNQRSFLTSSDVYAMLHAHQRRKASRLCLARGDDRGDDDRSEAEILSNAKDRPRCYTYVCSTKTRPPSTRWDGFSHAPVWFRVRDLSESDWQSALRR